MASTNSEGMIIPHQGTTIYDGGFYVPDNTKKPITIYRYFGFPDAQVRVPSSDENCTNIVLETTPDPKQVPRINAGGVIVSAMLNAEIGQIQRGFEIRDEKFMSALHDAVLNAETIKPKTN